MRHIFKFLFLVFLSTAASSFSSTDSVSTDDDIAPRTSRVCSFSFNDSRINDTNLEERALNALKRHDRGEIERSDGISINFNGNYINDDAIKMLVGFFTRDRLFAEKVQQINLDNNRITRAGLSGLKTLLTLCPQLKLTAAVNSFSNADFIEAFGEDATKSRIQISIY